MLLIVIIIWLQLLLNEVQVPSIEELMKQFSEEPDSDSKFEDELTEEENPIDTPSTEAQEEMQSRGSLEELRPELAYLSLQPTSQKQSLTATSDSWSESQKIRPSRVGKSNFCNIVMLLCTILSSLTWKFVCQLLQMSNVLRIRLLPSSLITYMAQLSVWLSEKVGNTLGSLGLGSRGLLASALGREIQANWNRGLKLLIFSGRK
ncbi:uncharacterized protein LJ264_010156 [Porphyrio hochstetteri]